ncbi:MAG: Crp/Fnr family transcriptional regulator [Bacteroidota bacterium]
MTKSYHTIHKPESPRDKATRLLLGYIREMTTFSAEEEEVLRESIKVRNFPKGAFIAEEGDYPTAECYFVLQGCVRKFYLVDGEEKTTGFYTEGQPVNVTTPQQKNAPCQFYLECLEETLVTLGDAEGEAAFFAQFPRFESVCRKQSEEMLGELERAMAQYMISSPEQRYLSLLENRPELLARVPQYHLASYVGVKPESLSRIRKRILQRHGS